MTIGKKIGVSLAAASAALASPALAQDAYQWLETPEDARALAWAKQETEAAQAKFAAMPGRAAIEAELKTLLAAGDPPPDFQLFGPVVLKFQRSVAHPHGVLSVGRRGADGVPGNWRDVLDVDAYGKAQGKVYELRFGGSSLDCAPPDYTRCLLPLSPLGGDEVEIREFDLASGKFVDGGFQTPQSRQSASWLDKDRVLIQHTANGAPALATGWPANLAIWQRGTPLSSAKVIYSAQPNDALMNVAVTGEGANRVGVISRAIDYSTFEHLVVRADGRTEKTNLPLKVKMLLGAVGGGRIYAQLSEAAEAGGLKLPAESVVAYDTRTGIPADRRLSLVYAPADGEYLTDIFSGFGPTRSGLAMVVDRRGSKRIVTATASDGGWTIRQGDSEPVGSTVGFAGTDPDGDGLIVRRAGYIVPNRLELVSGTQAPIPLFAEKPAMDASGLVAEIKTARSKDGTEVDYYLVRPRNPAKLGATPLLMTGYGAFGLSFGPEYFGYTVGGKAMIPWLTRGGAFAIPMMRGGGERGAAWHQAAMREKRQNSYDDFAAVTEALIKEGFTSPKHIGVFGSSNGGLLAAVMGTQRPDLYGAIVSDVPLTDLIRMPFMGMGAAWVNEYGDANDPAMLKVLNAYSPYQNVVKGKPYPPFLITVATSDNRVGPGHARKMAAKLKDAGATVYYLEDQEGGHGVSDPLSRPELMADRMTFLIDTLK